MRFKIDPTTNDIINKSFIDSIDLEKQRKLVITYIRIIERISEK